MRKYVPARQYRPFFESLREQPAKMAAYEAILEAALGLEGFVNLPRGIDVNWVLRCVKEIKMDVPELFALDSATAVYSGPDEDPNDFCLNLSYRFSAAEARKMLFKMDGLAHSILRYTYGENGYSVLLCVHDHLAANLRYGHEGAGIPSEHEIDSLLTGVAVCEGFAKSLKFIVDRAVGTGLKCAVVVGNTLPLEEEEGYAEKAHHAWNVCYVRNADFWAGWTNVDATLDAAGEKGSHPRHDYFGCSDKELSKTHVRVGEAALRVPPCTFSLGYYKRVGRYARTLAELEKMIRNWNSDEDPRLEFSMPLIDMPEESVNRVVMEIARNNTSVSKPVCFKSNCRRMCFSLTA